MAVTDQTVSEELSGLARKVRLALSESGIWIDEPHSGSRGGCTIVQQFEVGVGGSGGILIGWVCDPALDGGGPGAVRYDTAQVVRHVMLEAVWTVLEAFGFTTVAVNVGSSIQPLVIRA